MIIKKKKINPFYLGIHTINLMKLISSSIKLIITIEGLLNFPEKEIYFKFRVDQIFRVEKDESRAKSVAWCCRSRYKTGRLRKDPRQNRWKAKM